MVGEGGGIGSCFHETYDEGGLLESLQFSSGKRNMIPRVRNVECASLMSWLFTGPFADVREGGLRTEFTTCIEK